METNKKREQLIKIEIAREKIDYDLANEIITDTDILMLELVDSNFGFNNNKESYKVSVLTRIYNNPFLLCDLKNLSLEIKQTLPSFLSYRYNMELKELEYQFKQGFINKKELDEQKSLLEFLYYKTSNDGRNILENKFFVKNPVKCK